MSNTIDLLESIGRDASMRYASRENLTQALEGMGANAVLKLAAASGDRSHLAQELGGNDNKTNQNPNQNPNNGGCDPEEDGESEPDQDGDCDTKGRNH